MRMLWTLGGLVWMSFATSAQTPPTDAQISNQVRNLAHPRFVVREQAAKELEAIGGPALAALRLALNDSDEECKERAAKLIAKIEQRQRSERMLTAPKLTLNFDEMKLDAAVTELSRKTGISFQLDTPNVKNPQRLVTLKIEDVPFWDAVDRFYRAAGLTENDEQSTTRTIDETRGGRRIRYAPVEQPANHIRLKDGEPGTLLVKDKAVRVWVCTKHQSNKYDDTKGESQFCIKIDAAPALSMQGIVGIDVRKAIDNNQRRLLAASTTGFGVGESPEEVVMIQKGMVDLDNMGVGPFGAQRYQGVALKSEGIRPKQLEELVGVVALEALTSAEPLFTIYDITNPDAKRAATDQGLKCQITGTRKSGLSYMLVSVQLEMSNMDEMMNFPVQFKGRVRPFVRFQRSGTDPNGLPKMILQDQTGKVLKHAVVSTRMESDGLNMHYQLELRIEQPTATDRVSLTVEGRRSVTLEMPFALKNVPLP